MSLLQLSATKCHTCCWLPLNVTLAAIYHQVPHLLLAAIKYGLLLFVAKCHLCFCLPLCVTHAVVCYQVSHLLLSVTKCFICCCVIKSHSCSFLSPVSHLILPAIMCHPQSCLPPSVTFADLLPPYFAFAAVCHCLSHLLLSAIKCDSCWLSAF